MKMVRACVAPSKGFRRVQQRFHARGQAAWEHYQSTCLSLPADEVLTKLQAKLEFSRKQLGG